ncbi:MAG: hypothetical protein M0Z66_15310 [Thermaerobacter sp.]|nr:hypothetical protein [Thermaerobacter sp.]
MRFSGRALSIIETARAALPVGRQAMEPPDIMLGAHLLRGGVLDELYLHGQFDLAAIRLEAQRAASLARGPGVAVAPLPGLFSPASQAALARAQALQRDHGQDRIGTGELLRALLEDPVGAALLTASRSGLSRDAALELVAVPRDLIVRLTGFAASVGEGGAGTVVRRADPADRDALLAFVRREHGERWSSRWHTVSPRPKRLCSSRRWTVRSQASPATTSRMRRRAFSALWGQQAAAAARASANCSC